MNSPLFGLILYLIAVGVVAAFTFNKSKDLADYVLGGRKLGPWVIALSERASGESAWLLVGLPGAVLAAGMLELWTVIGTVSGILFSWFFVAYRLRVESERYDALTLPEFFSKRFGDDDNVLRILSSVIITFFFTFYVAAQFAGAGKVLNVTFGLAPTTGMILGAVVIVGYTIAGGFLAVAWTDVVQAIIMFGTLVIIPIVGLIELGGFAGLQAGLSKVNPDLVSVFGGKTGFAALAAVLGGASWGLGYVGQPHLVVRFMALDSAESVKRGRAIAAGWSFPALFGALLLGLVGLALYGNVFDDVEKLMPYMATQLLPGWLAGIFISGAIAAMMSTADSQLLVTSSVLSEDVYRRFLHPRAGQARLVAVGRWITVGVGVLAFGMALSSQKLVFALVSFAWSGLGASFGPALLAALWWPKTSRAGVIAGMVTGTVVTVLWAKVPFLAALVTERVSSFALAALAVLVFSYWKPVKKAKKAIKK